MAQIKAIATQAGNVSPGTNGQEKNLSASLLGQLATVDWKQFLVSAGRCWSVTAGGLTADADVTRITGGGAGTTIDMEQPEIIVGVDSGYFIAAIEIEVAVYVSLIGGGQGQTANIMLMGDNSVGVPTSVTGTTETPTNLLDGGPSFPGRAYSGISVDIADPGTEIILGCKTVNLMNIGTNAGPAIFEFNYHKVFDVPHWIAGPGSIYLCFGGVTATAGVANLTVACIPSTWLPTS